MIFARKNKRDGNTYFFVRYDRPDGRPKQEKVPLTLDGRIPTRLDAREFLTRRRAEVLNKTWIDPDAPAPEAPGGPTFDTFAGRFLKEHPGKRRSDHYPDTLKRLTAHFGDRPLASITRSDLDQFRVALLSAKARSRAGTLSPTTVVKVLRTLGRMFKMAVRWGVLEVNPAADLEKPSIPNGKTRFLSEAEARKLEKSAPIWLRPMVGMALATGMRLKEITGLRWEDVDLGSGFLHVSQDSKTGTRVVPLTKAARRILKAQVRHVRSPFVFVDRMGGDYTSEHARDRVGKQTKAAMVAAGIDGASFHVLRHTAASWMVQRGIALFEVQMILGHSTPTMTQRYAHLAPNHLKRAAQALDAALRRKSDDSMTSRVRKAKPDAEVSRASA